MTHPLVLQLWFARSEYARCLEGISDTDARQRIMPMNCISWMIGHLATQEQWYWVKLAQGELPFPELYTLVGFGRPASTPPLVEMWHAWENITKAADDYLKTLSTDVLQTYFSIDDQPAKENVGTMLLRTIYHYWFHTGEAHAVRQQLGHKDLPQFVGRMETAVYIPE